MRRLALLAIVAVLAAGCHQKQPSVVAALPNPNGDAQMEAKGWTLVSRDVNGLPTWTKGGDTLKVIRPQDVPEERRQIDAWRLKHGLPLLWHAEPLPSH